jgi:redox-sensitive bicupin YhaK (pirin superfamily)
LKPKRHAWVQVATGKVTLNGLELKAGDGAAISDEKKLEISGKEESQVLVFDLN